MKPHGAIIAGGRSSRFGAPKSDAVLDGARLLEIVAGRLKPQTARAALNVVNPTTTLAERARSLGLAIVEEPEPAEGEEPKGPLQGVSAALEWARRDGAAALVTSPVDTPFLPTNLVDRLGAAAADGVPVCASSGGRRHGLCTLWPIDLTDRFQRLFERERVYGVNMMLDRLEATTVDFPIADRDPFTNINTQADLQAAQRSD